MDLGECAGHWKVFCFFVLQVLFIVSDQGASSRHSVSGEDRCDIMAGTAVLGRLEQRMKEKKEAMPHVCNAASGIPASSVCAGKLAESEWFLGV